MKPVLLVSGCSVTHGAELYNGFMSPENVKRSFSTTLANKLDCDLVNVALSGSSNEYIFHSIIAELDKHKDINSILVVWTWIDRLYWKNKNKHWFFVPKWACSLSKLEDFERVDKINNGVKYVSDSDEYLPILEEMHKFIVTHYFDNFELLKKLMHYRKILNEICAARKIKLVDITTKHFERIGTWRKENRHPDIDEHMQIADFIYNTFYRDKNG